MTIADIIAEEAKSLPPEKQAAVLYFIEFLKHKQQRAEQLAMPKTAEEMPPFFDGFNVDLSGFKFDRDDANAR